jgi:hypothetical protein
MTGRVSTLGFVARGRGRNTRPSCLLGGDPPLGGQGVTALAHHGQVILGVGALAKSWSAALRKCRLDHVAD